MESHESVDVFGESGSHAADRAAAVGRFVVAMGFFLAGFILIGIAMSHQDSAGIIYYMGGIIGVTIGCALPFGLRDR